MKKEKVGLALFWLGVIWAFFWGILGSLHQNIYYGHVLTFEAYEQSIWATTGPLQAVWGFGPPLGALIAAIGLLLYADAKGSTAAKFGIGVFLAFIISFVIGTLGHFPLLFAIGGTLILSSFFGILWLWAKKRKALEGDLATATDLKLAGYVFILIAVWFTCGIAGPQWIKAFADQPPMMEPFFVQLLFALGWICLFLGHYKER